MAKKSFLRPLGDEVRLRFMIETQKGIVKDFLVQLEVLYLGAWRACIRYNYAHGRPHIDFLYADGRRRKRWLSDVDLSRLIDTAQKDLSENFDMYVGQMGY